MLGIERPGLSVAGRPYRARSVRATLGPLAAATALAGPALVAAGVTTLRDLSGHVHAHPAFALGAPALGLAGLAVVAGFALAVSR